ncbi:MAG: hypothetical protein K9H14_07915 [Actinomycetia bacterium]|nr:hypothetical protein [Actinomycetes bacterium]
MISVKQILYLAVALPLVCIIVFSFPGFLVADTNLLVNGDFGQDEDLSIPREGWYKSRDNSDNAVIENGVARVDSSDINIEVDIAQVVETSSLDLTLTFDVIRKIDGNIRVQYILSEDGYITYMGKNILDRQIRDNTLLSWEPGTGITI